MIKSKIVRIIVWELSAAVLLVFAFYKNFENSKGTLTEKANIEFRKNADDISQKIENKLVSLTQTSKDLRTVLEKSEFTHSELTSVLSSVASQNESIFGLCAAYEPFAFDKKTEFYEPYFYKEGDSLVYVNYDLIPEDYLSKDWYKPARDSLKPFWTEPYADSTAGMIVMATYTIPLLNSDGTLKGVLATDIFLHKFSTFLNEIETTQHGYTFLFSKENSILSHPDTSLIMHQTMQTLSEKYKQPILKSIADSVNAGKSGYSDCAIFLKQKDVTLYYSRLSSGWGFVVVVPKRELYADIESAKKQNLNWFLISMLVVTTLILSAYFLIINKLKNKRSKELETLIYERTEQIHLKNKELEAQKNALKERNSEMIATEEELRQNNEELLVLKESLEERNIELGKASLQLKERAFIGEILSLSMQADLSVNDFLQKSLDLILTLPWLNVLSQGSVFLTNTDGNLEMTAQKDLGILTKLCAVVRPGQCYCGRALSEKRQIFHDHVSENHDIRFDGMTEHGHYNIPLMYNDTVLGVLNLYAEHEHEQTDTELDFLKTISSLIATVIYRTQIKKTIENQTQELKAKNSVLSELNTELNKYYVALDQSPITFVITDTFGKIEYVNPHFTKLTGYTQEEAIGLNPRILKTSKTPKHVFTEMWKTISSGEIWTGTLYNKTKAKEPFTERAIIAPIKNSQGAIVNYVAIKEDITEFEQAKFLVAEKTRQFENTIENLEDIYFKADIDGNLVYASPSIFKHLGYKTLQNIIDKKIFEKIYLNDKFKTEFLESIYKVGKFSQYKIALTDAWDGIFHGTMNVAAQYDTDKNPVGFEGIIHNITARKKYEQEQKRLNKEILNSLEITNQQKIIIENAHKNITDSINYAKSIQESMLMKPELLKDFVEEHLLIYRPKEVVSGDFYYVSENGDTKIFAVADCTGHGVPGGFLSMLGITFLSEIIKRDKAETPAKALEMLRHRFKSTFKNFGNENSNGLDIALCFINTQTNELQFSGANNPIYILQGSEIKELSPTKNPIGFYPVEKPFQNTTISLNTTDIVYMFTDGYADQFGGTHYRKFMSKRLRELLQSISEKSIENQQGLLEDTLSMWQNEAEQTDDITVLGFRCNF